MAIPIFMEFSDVWILYLVILFLIIHYVWEEYLSYRQRKVYKHSCTVPEVVANKMSQTTFDKARFYNLERSQFATYHSLFDMVVGLILLLLGAYPYVWDLSNSILVDMGYPDHGEITCSLVFVTILLIFSQLLSIPWSFYSTFVIEENHGFNKQTYAFFAKDNVKKLIVTFVIMIPLIAGIIYIIQWGGDYFFIYLSFFFVLITLFFMTIYPSLIAPLFDKYTPLPEGELRDKIEALAASLHFPLKKLYVVEGSKRSAHSNAYLYGFFNNKRIVLYDVLLADWYASKSSSANSVSSPTDSDTPLAQLSTNENTDTCQPLATPESTQSETVQSAVSKGCSNDEVVAVLAHELGHWKHSHVVINFFIVQINTLLMFAGFSLLYKCAPLYTAFGFEHEQPLIVGMVIIMQYVFVPYQLVVSFLTVFLVRQFEFQADRFATKLGYSQLLKTSLIKLSVDNLSFPLNDPWYSAWHHSHPPLLERLQAIDKQD